MNKPFLHRTVTPTVSPVAKGGGREALGGPAFLGLPGASRGAGSRNPYSSLSSGPSSGVKPSLRKPSVQPRYVSSSPEDAPTP